MRTIAMLISVMDHPFLEEMLIQSTRGTNDRHTSARGVRPQVRRSGLATAPESTARRLRCIHVVVVAGDRKRFVRLGQYRMGDTSKDNFACG